MFNKYAELRKIALLYTACRGLLRIKMAGFGDPVQDEDGDWDAGQYDYGTPQQKPQAKVAPMSNNTQMQQDVDPDWDGGQYNQANYGNTGPRTQPKPQPQQPQPQQQRKPVNPMQLKMMSQQQYMQNHQKQIQQAGQQAQQNATKGWFGKAMNWLTGGGYGGWAQGRAQAQKQQYYNNRYNQQAQQLKQRQQQYQRRQTGQQIQKFLMSRQPQQQPKAAGYSLLKLFPGYQQLINYV